MVVEPALEDAQQLLDLGSVTERAQARGDELSRSFLGQPEQHMLFLELWQRAVRAAPDGRLHDDTLLAYRRDLHATITEAIAATVEDTRATLPLASKELATVLLALSHGSSKELRVDRAYVPDDLFGLVLALQVRQR